MSFGATIRRLRLERRLTLAELGALTGAAMSAGAVSSVESGRSDNPTEETVRRFARAFGLSVAELRALAGLDPPSGASGDLAGVLAGLRALPPNAARDYLLEHLEAESHQLTQADQEKLLRFARRLLEEYRAEQQPPEADPPPERNGSTNQQLQVQTT